MWTKRLSLVAAVAAALVVFLFVPSFLAKVLLMVAIAGFVLWLFGDTETLQWLIARWKAWRGGGTTGET